MARRIDILSPAVLAGFVAFCFTLDPLWFLGVSGGVLVTLFGALLVMSAIGSAGRSDVAPTDAYPAE